MNPQDAWDLTIQQLSMQLDHTSFATWLQDAVLLTVDAADDAGGDTAEVFVIGVRNGYARDMLQYRLYPSIRKVLSDVCGQPIALRFEIQQPQTQFTAQAAGDGADTPLFQLLAQQRAAADDSRLPLHQQIMRPQQPDLPGSELNPRCTFDRFIAGMENELILSAAQAVAEYPATTYNPFFVYGGVGLGKTHLLQAIAHECQARGQHVIYIPSEVFTNDLVDAIRHRTTAMFRDRYRSVDVLLIDDIQFMAGKESTQEEFFHTFNALYTFNKQVVLASDRPPSELVTLEDRLRSRFEGGLVMDIQPPGVETRCAILETWAEERGLTLPPRVAELVAGRTDSNVRELAGVFNQLVAALQLMRGPLTVAVAEDILNGYRRPRHRVTVMQVIEVTARHHGLTVDDLTGKRRTGPINQARQIAMYLAREITPASLPQIGTAFGGRKHSTVLHSCNKVTESLGTNTALRTVVTDIRERLLRGEH
ncbi:MAG: chromosomal replication initiator protein DnaA [Chloroflexi bacterium]|nr:chromosomal replication initiator protein DnaA [Chloroflexota bacterium]